MTQPLEAPPSSEPQPPAVTPYRHRKILELLYNRNTVAADELAAEFPEVLALHHARKSPPVAPGDSAHQLFIR